VTANSSRHAFFLRSFTSNESAIRAYVRRLLPSRADTDDIMQGVALVLWAKFEQFREDGDFRSWAMGIARYEVLAWLRDRGRDRLVLAGDVAEMIAEETAIDVAQLEQQRIALQSCLEKLTPKNRSLLLESYGSELMIQEVAASSGRSIAAFYQWLHRTRRLLLDCVQHEVAR
jgi:RNA polymerase sigma-70 factor (ECF subfamily)